MKKPIIHITDHALIRYLERVLGVDVERLRRRIGRELDKRWVGQLGDPKAIKVNGVEYRMKGKSVITCMPIKPLKCNRRKLRG